MSHLRNLGDWKAFQSCYKLLYRCVSPLYWFRILRRTQIQNVTPQVRSILTLLIMNIMRINKQQLKNYPMPFHPMKFMTGMKEWRLLCASMTIESISRSIREMQPSALRWLSWLQWKATCYRSWQMWTCPVSCSVSLPASKVAFTRPPSGPQSPITQS